MSVIEVIEHVTIYENPIPNLVSRHAYFPGLAKLPSGDIIAECNTFDNDVVVGTCFPELIGHSLGRKFIRARRPSLYSLLVVPPETPPKTTVGWM